ncbi:hypothetical protein [Absidia glauca]|uniref:Late embryogenesis abundant protein LEA-2 subgroup domain-containing protein n=1 Tax=Absidia glauca TaxID=4829 RepID=A0A163MPY0_ABSGL|nr:hypothetical protein [Absidia glauca]
MSKFIMPTIEIGGVTNSTGTTGKSSSPLSFNGDKLQLNFGLTVLAKNPNLLPIYVSDMNATAFYPDPKGTGKMSPVGGGYLAYQELPKYSDFNFTFPFSIVYDPLEDPDQTILNDLAEKCGLTGDEPTDLTIAYTIHVTAKVLFVSVHPTIDSQSTFPCPIQVSSNASADSQ